MGGISILGGIVFFIFGALFLGGIALNLELIHSEQNHCKMNQLVSLNKILFIFGAIIISSIKFLK
jgi:hypothetical protein